MSERRRVPRIAFGGVAEITSVHPDTYIVVPTTELSRFGCLVRTYASMPIGTKVSLKISYEDNVFNASGEVAYALSEGGMGVKFTVTVPKDVAILEAWLSKQTEF
jgi:hypothetical protein